jgi:hypothetical protein
VEYTSIKSDPKLSKRDHLLLALAVVVGGGGYLIASALIYHTGFPLDDSWIHLTYARNLALHGQWAFQLGYPSAGSTAPLWTFLLALGFWLNLAPYFWTYFLGGLALFGLAILAEGAARRRVAAYRPRLPWIGFFFILEWHLTWAAMSGMETLLQALILTGVLVLLISGSRRYLTLGLLTGLSVWVRPDGLTLLGPVIVTILLIEKSSKLRGSALGRYLIGFGALFLPYLFFNLGLSGTPMPNTFYAKQTEYAAWQASPLGDRLGVLFIQLLVGPSLVLVPGVLASVILAIRRRSWSVLAAVAWCAGYLLLYILRLPAYQHGRYLMPAMPVFFLMGLLPILEFRRSTLFGRRHWMVQAAWQSSLILLTLLFFVIGARQYGEDVGLIESEMVVTARWVALELPPGAVIAAHDIGALGYFDDHRLIDLAGLISPEVIPIMRDESRLADFLNQKHADYLIAFPDTYPNLIRTAAPVFTTGGRFAPAQGEKNMTVYRWNGP